MKINKEVVAGTLGIIIPLSIVGGITTSEYLKNKNTPPNPITTEFKPVPDKLITPEQKQREDLVRLLLID